MTNSSLKQVVYRGGLVTFRIPSHWVEEYEDDGGGAFYDEQEGSRTLRLNVITIETPPDLQGHLASEAIKACITSDHEPELLSNGDAMVSFADSMTDDGCEIEIRFWVKTHAVDRTIRIANFAYTYLAADKASPSLEGELRLLDEVIREAELSGSST